MAAKQAKYTSALDTIGNTPIIKLQKIVPDSCTNIYAKLESYNPTGSKKDKMALAMIEGAEKRGELRPGMTVVEYTGGSTGSALAFVCAVKGYGFAKPSQPTMTLRQIDGLIEKADQLLSTLVKGQKKFAMSLLKMPFSLKCSKASASNASAHL